MKIKSMTITALMSLAMASPLSFAGEDSGKASGDAMMNKHETPFAQLDTNKDGYLSEDELNVHGSTAAGNASDDEMMGEDNEVMMMERDKDGDGKLSKREYEKGAKKDW